MRAEIKLGPWTRMKDVEMGSRWLRRSGGARIDSRRGLSCQEIRIQVRLLLLNRLYLPLRVRRSPSFIDWRQRIEPPSFRGKALKVFMTRIFALLLASWTATTLWQQGGTVIRAGNESQMNIQVNIEGGVVCHPPGPTGTERSLTGPKGGKAGSETIVDVAENARSGVLGAIIKASRPPPASGQTASGNRFLLLQAYKSFWQYERQNRITFQPVPPFCGSGGHRSIESY